MDAHASKEESTLFLRLILDCFRGWNERVLRNDRVAEAALVMYTLSLLALVLTNA